MRATPVVHRVLLPILLSIGLPATVAAQLPPAGPVLQVNVVSEGSQDNPVIATSADGTSLVAWVVQSSRVVARRIVSGVPAAGEIELGPIDPERFVETVAVAARPAGGWLVAWGEGKFRQPTEIYLQAVDSDGGTESPAIPVGQGAQHTIRGLGVAVDDRGRTVVAWQGTTGDRALAARFFDSAGEPVGGLVTFADVAGDPALVATSQGFLVAYGRPGEEENELVVRLFDPLGNSPEPPSRADASDGASERRPVLAPARDGGALMVWSSETVVDGQPPQPGSDAVLARRLGPRGAPAGDILRLDRNRERRKILTGLAALPGGAFVASWTGPAGGPSGEVGYGIAGRFLDADGRPEGEELELYRDERSAVFQHDLAAGSDGSLTVAWSSCHPVGFVAPGSDPCGGGDDGDGLGIFARRFDFGAGGVVTPVAGPRVVGEGGVAVTVRVERLGGSDGVVTVDLATGEPTGPASATPGLDFESRFVTLVWGDGDATAREVRIPLVEDSRREPDETFTVELSNPTGGAVLADPSRVGFTIVDDDGVEPLLQTGFTVEVGPEASACDGERLAGLLARLRTEAPGTSKPVGVNLSLTASGDFSGIAYTGNGPGTAEHHLAFSTNPEATTLLRNPARPQLETVGFTRNRLASDLVEPGDTDLLRLILDPTLASNTDPPPNAFLVIDDLSRSAGGRPSDAKPGRGLLPLSERCHDRLGSGDEHALRILQKLVRAETPGAVRQEVALYPAAERGVYRIDVRPYAADGTPLGLLAAEVAVEYAFPVSPLAGPFLVRGVLRGLPLCDGAGETGCTSLRAPTTLYLVHPRFSGEFWEPTPYRIEAGPDTPGGSVEVDFADLLEGTMWQEAGRI